LAASFILNNGFDAACLRNALFAALQCFVAYWVHNGHLGEASRRIWREAVARHLRPAMLGQ
jgi:hypothetical protein